MIQQEYIYFDKIYLNTKEACPGRLPDIHVYTYVDWLFSEQKELFSL